MFFRNLKNSFYVQSLVSLVVKVLGAASVFFVTFAIARILSPEHAGLFFLSFTILTVAATIARFGLENSVVRFISRFYLKKQQSLVQAVYRTSLTWVLALSLVLASMLWLSADVIAEMIFARPALSSTLRVMAIALPIVNVMMMHGQYLLGLKYVTLSTIALNLGWAASFLVALVFFDVANSQDAAYVYLFSVIAACILAVVLWKKMAVSAKPRHFNKRILLASSMPLWLVQIVSLVNVWIPPLLLGFWFAPDQVAEFHVVLRIAMLISFAMVAINAVVAPRFSELYVQNDYKGLEVLAKRAALALMAISLPLFIIVETVPQYILALFGNSYVDVIVPLRILALTELITGILGASGFLLIMSGNEKTLRNNLCVAGSLSLIVALLLIPTMGLLGAVIATGVGHAGSNLFSTYMVRRKLGFWPIPLIG